MLELALHNPSAVAHWYIVPDAVSREFTTTLGPVNGCDVYLLGDSRRVTVAHFQGQGGFYALLLPPGLTMRLRDLGVEMEFRELQATLILTITITTGIYICGVPAQQWCAIDWICDQDALVTMSAATLLRECWPDESPELSVEVEEPQHIDVALPVAIS